MLACGCWGNCWGNELDQRVKDFVANSCTTCHDSNTDTSLDLSRLGTNLNDSTVFRQWVEVFDRVDREEMPPAGEEQPGKQARQVFLKQLRNQLHESNLQKQRTGGRVPSRRLTRREYENTLRDLLNIGGKLARFLPPENESGSFALIGTKQEMSSVHIRGFMVAADKALEEAIQLGQKPEMEKRQLDYYDSKYMKMWVERPVLMGGGTVFLTDTDVVTFRGENFVFRSDQNGYRPTVAGNYRISVRAAPYQQRSSITVSLKRQNDIQGDSELFAAWDLSDNKYRDLETVQYLRPDDYFYVSADELEPAPDGKVIYSSQPASQFKGEGVSIRSVFVEGPLETSWPPQRTQNLFPNVSWKLMPSRKRFGRQFRPQFAGSAKERIRDAVERLAILALGRKLSELEMNRIIALADSKIKNGDDWVDAARQSLKAVLVSPELIFFTGHPGPLKTMDLSRRLSYFLWRSIPDQQLVKELSRQKNIAQKSLIVEVDRMIASPKFDRFVKEFLDEWLDLDKIDATTPDQSLYPEYDDVLRRAMLGETRQFFLHLIRENLSVANLIDSDFTFLNRRLAEHYQIDGVRGEDLRKVQLGPNHVRGGILGQASIAKVTANGTVTTPVKRGNFVLTNLLGTPPNPPPASVGSIEPDTRGATTIRQTLKKHQTSKSCANCHRHIDPPGFAMESLDPVGIFRNRYRNSKDTKAPINIGLRFLHKTYWVGKPVDSSGKTAAGDSFSGLQQYKKLLMKSKEQVARNFVSKLIEFSTGGEIEFADREVVERILNKTRSKGFLMKDLMHQVVLSRLFRNR